MLGALDSKGMLTTKGLNMSVFPMSPILSSVLITSKKYHCTSDIVTIVSMLQVSNELFYRPKETERRMYETIKNELLITCNILLKKVVVFILIFGNEFFFPFKRIFFDVAT